MEGLRSEALQRAHGAGGELQAAAGEHYQPGQSQPLFRDADVTMMLPLYLEVERRKGSGRGKLPALVAL